MEKFYEWWGTKDIPAEYLESALLDAFKAGMMAAADIADDPGRWGDMYKETTPPAKFCRYLANHILEEVEDEG